MPNKKQLPTIALASLPTPPPPGSIQFFDGYFPALPAGDYTIGLTHTLSGFPVPATPPPAPFPAFAITPQSFTVQAPQFFIDTTIVQTAYPPAGNSDQYEQRLPFVVMTDPSLPWERSLIPGSPPSSSNPTPWMALLIFAEGEINMPANTNNPVTTSTVFDLLTPDPANMVLKPNLSLSTISADIQASTCQTITIPGAVFNAIMPSTADLPYLAHCRGINTIDEGEQLLSVLLCNRLALADTTGATPAPLRYYAHVVSLEGYGNYLSGGGTAIPNKPGGGLMDVQLVSLYNWTFVSLPQTGQSFEALVTGLIQNETATQGALSLPIPSSVALPTDVEDRLNDGYAPLTFVSGAGDESFAWYRGPFSAVVPQMLPDVGNQPAPVVESNSANALMIYLAQQGLFDLSYAAAWNIGRNLALADAHFAQNVTTYRQAANNALSTLAQRMSMPLLAGETNIKNLLANNASRSKFNNTMRDGLGKQWTDALAFVRKTPAPVAENVQRINRNRKRNVLHPRDLLAHPGVVDAISENINDIINFISQWLNKLSLLNPVPFSYMVPDSRMLPVESIRFFYVDPNWLEALTAGAMSIAIHSSKDVAIYKALLPSFTTSTGGDRSGMLIRSQLVSGWPKLVVSATLDNVPVTILRNECLSPNVRLVMFDGIPDSITLAEPYQGLLFGVEDNNVINPRCVTSPAYTGAVITNANLVIPTFRAMPPANPNGVIDIQATASVLETTIGITPFKTGDTVLWNGTPLPTTLRNGQLNATVSNNEVATAGIATITVQSGTSVSLPANFIINAALAIDAINPVMMLAGADEFMLTVSGVGFDTNAAIQWNGTALTTTVISSVESTAQVPASLVTSIGTATITVLSNSTTSNSVTINIVGGNPVIDTIQPNVMMAGSNGFLLTISGSGFTSDAVVEWSGTKLPTTYVNEQQLTAAVTANKIATPGSIPVTVVINGTASAPVNFTIANQIPTIGSIQPSVAMAGGTSVDLTVNGVNFDTTAQIQWNGTPLVNTVYNNSGQLTVAVPTSYLTGGIASISVISKSVTSNAMPFTVLTPQPAIGLLEPASAIAGSPSFTLIVTGSFGAGDFALQMVAAPEFQSFTK